MNARDLFCWEEKGAQEKNDTEGWLCSPKETEPAAPAGKEEVVARGAQAGLRGGCDPKLARAGAAGWSGAGRVGTPGPDCSRKHSWLGEQLPPRGPGPDQIWRFHNSCRCHGDTQTAPPRPLPRSGSQPAALTLSAPGDSLAPPPARAPPVRGPGRRAAPGNPSLPLGLLTTGQGQSWGG